MRTRGQEVTIIFKNKLLVNFFFALGSLRCAYVRRSIIDMIRRKTKNCRKGVEGRKKREFWFFFIF